jgi:hypothetical protein
MAYIYKFYIRVHRINRIENVGHFGASSGIEKHKDTEYSSSIHIIFVQFREDEKTLH